MKITEVIQYVKYVIHLHNIWYNSFHFIFNFFINMLSILKSVFFWSYYSSSFKYSLTPVLLSRTNPHNLLTMWSRPCILLNIDSCLSTTITSSCLFRLLIILLDDHSPLLSISILIFTLVMKASDVPSTIVDPTKCFPPSRPLQVLSSILWTNHYIFFVTSFYSSLLLRLTLNWPV